MSKLFYPLTSENQGWEKHKIQRHFFSSKQFSMWWVTGYKHGDFYMVHTFCGIGWLQHLNNSISVIYVKGICTIHANICSIKALEWVIVFSLLLWSTYCYLDKVLAIFNNIKFWYAQTQVGAPWNPKGSAVSAIRWSQICYNDEMRWKHFPHHWPFVWGIHQWPVDYPVLQVICDAIKLMWYQCNGEKKLLWQSVKLFTYWLKLYLELFLGSHPRIYIYMYISIDDGLVSITDHFVITDGIMTTLSFHCFDWGFM